MHSIFDEYYRHLSVFQSSYLQINLWDIHPLSTHTAVLTEQSHMKQHLRNNLMNSLLHPLVLLILPDVMAYQINTKRNCFLLFHARSGVFNVHTIVVNELSNSSDEQIFSSNRNAIDRMVILTYINIYT